MGEGTSRELWEAGVFGDDDGAYYAYNQSGRALHKARHRKNDLPKRGAAGQHAQCQERKAAQAEEQKAEAAGAAADQRIRRRWTTTSTT